jgi:hypothetical protein
MTIDGDVLAWLLDTDPALRWQVERDLTDAPPSRWRATRARVAHEGLGSALLARQDPDGQWAGGAYFPAGFFGSPEQDEAGQPYTATTWSLSTLREWGVESDALAGTVELLAENSRWEYDDLPYWDGEVDCCINAFTLANGAWLGADVSALADWFPEHVQPDGGFNCEWVEGSRVSSFHSTLNSIRGILDYERRTGGTDALRRVRHSAEDYLLRHRLLYRLGDGEPVGDWASVIAYPFRWQYTALRAVDHFRAAALHDGADSPHPMPDPRLADAIEGIRSARSPDGRWTQQKRYPGRTWFEADVPVGEPSPWLTFYATRALRWWDAEN